MSALADCAEGAHTQRWFSASEMLLDCSEGDGNDTWEGTLVCQMSSLRSYVMITWTVVTGVITMGVSWGVFLNEGNVRHQCPSKRR